MNLEAFAKSFVRLGGSHAFGVPGGGASLQLADALERRGVKFITTGHETTAALMAGAMGRQTGSPSLAISIKGPGFINLASGLLANAYEGNPMISVAEAYPPSAGGARRHKWLNHSRVVEEFLKAHFFFADDAELMDACWAMAKTEFPGPAHVELVAGENASAATSPPKLDDVAPLIAAIRTAQRPVLIVGSCGLRAPWRKLLTSLTLPIFTTPAAKGLIPEDQTNSAGIYTGDGKELSLEKQILPQADIVITLGLRAGEILNPAAPSDRWIEVEQAELRTGSLFPPQAERAGRLYLSSEGIAEACAALARHRWGIEVVAAARDRITGAFLRWPWSVTVALERAQQTLPSAVHVLDTGNFTVLAEHFLKVPDEHSLIGTPNGRFMGMGIGFALGACLANPERPVVLWVGDGGVRAFLGELALAAEHRMKLLVLVVKDGFFGSVRGRAISQGWTTSPLRVQNRGFDKLVEAMGFVTGQVDNESSLERALKFWCARSAPGLLELAVDPDAYIEMTDLLR